jgi:hypothetical protein
MLWALAKSNGPVKRRALLYYNEETQYPKEKGKKYVIIMLAFL